MPGRLFYFTFRAAVSTDVSLLLAELYEGDSAAVDAITPHV